MTRLLTKELLKQIPDTSKDAGLNPMLYAKLFVPEGNWTWYIAQYNPETQECFGYCIGMEKEWGYFNLKELESILRGSLRIERDKYFEPKRFNEIKE